MRPLRHRLREDPLPRLDELSEVIFALHGAASLYLSLD
jgi:hypothetical protein